MKVALIEDEELILYKEQALIEKEFSKQKELCELVAYSDGQDFLYDYGQKKEFDLIILDVVLPRKSGMEIVREIREKDKKVYIVLVTAHEQYAVYGYDYQVYAFVDKTKYEEKLTEVCQRVINDFRQKYKTYYYIQGNKVYIKFLMDDIVYIERSKKYITFYTQNGEEYKERTTLSKVYEKLDSERFLYINKGQIINLRYVTYLSGNLVRLNGESIFSISRTCGNNVRKKLGKYWGNYV